MKFVNTALFLVALLGTSAIGSAVRLNSGNKKTTGETGKKRFLQDGKGKNGKGKGKAPACSTCNELLPGYTFYGEEYLEENFWEEFDGGSNFFAAIATFLSEAIYKSDVFRCLLTSLSTTARESICVLQDIVGVPNPDVPGSNVYPPPPGGHEGHGRKLSERNLHILAQVPAEASTDATLIAFMHMSGLDSIEAFVVFMGLEDILCEFLSPLNMGFCRRRLSPDIRPDGEEIGESLDEELYALFDPDTLQDITSEAFFLGTCGPNGDQNPFCVFAYSLLKTLDASMCYYQKEAGCSVSGSCTADLKFTTEYNSRALARYLPDFLSGIDFVIADILAPCTQCALSDSDGCSGFCNFVENHHTCDPVKRSFIAQEYGTIATFAADIAGDFYGFP